MNKETNLHVIKKLTTKQQEIVNNMTYPNFVKASAGTGKTEVVVQKILKLLEVNNATLDQFAIITFTNKATNEMKERLLDRLYLSYLKMPDNRKLRRQIDISNILDISTIHSFCEKIIRKYGTNINIPNNFVISSYRFETDEIIASILNQYADNEYVRDITLYKLKDLIKKYYYENENKGLVIPDNIADKLVLTGDELYDNLKRIFVEAYLKSYYEIENKKREDNILTQNDLIKYAALLLQDKYVAKTVSNKYKYLFIDEFQDTSIDQFNLVKAFIDNGVNVFVVGDEKQSIYKFRGSDINSFYQMTDIITEIKNLNNNNSGSVSINENFRTDYQLLNDINKVFNSTFFFNRKRIPFKNLPLDKIESLKKEQPAVKNSLQVYYNTKLSLIIKNIIENETLKGKEIKYKDIAVLCRRNLELDEYAEELKDENIPVEVVGGKGFYKAKEIIDTYKVLNAIINKGNLEYEELKFTCFYKSYISSKNDFDNLIDELRISLRESTISNFLEILYSKTNIKKYFKHFNNYQATANLLKLQNISREKMYEEGLQPIDFLHFLDIMISTNKEEDEAELSKKDRELGAVSLYSIHRAKGLDFKIVIIPDFDLNLNRSTLNAKIISKLDDEKYYLGFNSYSLFVNDEDKKHKDETFELLKEENAITNLEEEIRILYVAMTRAKHLLVLSNKQSLFDLMSLMKNNYYVSYFRWLYEIDKGNFLKQHEK